MKNLYDLKGMIIRLSGFEGSLFEDLKITGFFLPSLPKQSPYEYDTSGRKIHFYFKFVGIVDEIAPYRNTGRTSLKGRRKHK